MMSTPQATHAQSKATPPVRLLWQLLGFVISLALAGYIATKVNWADFLALVSGISAWSLALAVGIYIMLNFFRAVRFRVLLARDISLGLMFPVSMYHNFLVRVLPFRLGEVSYIAMLRHYAGYPVAGALGSLLGARLFELALVALAGLIGLAFGWEDSGTGKESTLLVLAGLLAALTGSIYFSGAVSNALGGLFGSFANRTDGGLSRLLGKLGLKLDELGLSLKTLRSPDVFVPTIGVTLITYGSSLAFNWLLLRLAGVNAGAGTMLTVISIGMLAANFPISFAGLGVIEGGWTLGLVTLAGLEVGEAASIGFFIHACQLLSAAVSGLLGYVLLQVRVGDGR